MMSMLPGMLTVASPSGSKQKVFHNPIVVVLVHLDGRPKAFCDELERGIVDRLRDDPRRLEITILGDWHMSIIWGARGSDFRSREITLGSDERNYEAIIRRLDEELVALK
jgi:hypothetical protein